ncbi:MAG: helix-turn-helix domain-containing protein [Bacteroidota bacterium]
MKLYIKYMVSLRCKMVVRAELEKMGVHYVNLELGYVETMENLTDQQLQRLKMALLEAGLELMDDKKAVLIEKIKNIIIEMVHYSDEMPKINHSDYISEKLGQDYTHIAKIFSEVKGITVEHYIIAHKIERVKELLLYDELSLTQISYMLNYSSVAHLSQQFKKVTGLTPSFFKQLKVKKRITLDNL